MTRPGTARRGPSAVHAVLVAAALAAPGAPATANPTDIADARYERPVQRYGHFALGAPHEYARLSVTTRSGRTVTLELPDDEVFEDRAPRLVSLAEAEPVRVLAIVSARDTGARLVLFGLDGEGLAIRAQSEPIGTPMRWLNPVGVADLDGDGHAEFAAVLTPHIGGTLAVYRQRGEALVEIATLGGFSNHVYGSPELGLSAIVRIAGRPRLLVPDVTRRWMRVVKLQDDRLVESGRCGLGSPVTGAVEAVVPGVVSVQLLDGRRTLALDPCQGAR